MFLLSKTQKLQKNSISSQDTELQSTVQNQNEILVNISPSKQKKKALFDCIKRNKNLHFTENDSPLTNFSQEKIISDTEYYALGFRTKDVYEKYLRYACENNEEINLLSTTKFRNQQQNLKLNLTIQVIKEIDQELSKDDWIIENQNDFQNLDEMYMISRLKLSEQRKNLECFINEQVDQLDAQTSSQHENHDY